MNAVVAADRSIEIQVDPDWLDPEAFWRDRADYDLVHLNYHRGLHSRWTPTLGVPDVIEAGLAVVITFHDTYETQPDQLPWELLDRVAAMVVHEPCDLQRHEKVRYWRQPCPERTGLHVPSHRAFDGGWHPTLGTVGFDFPWKNYDLLAQVTGELGWNLRIVGQVDTVRAEQLARLNPRIGFDGYTSTDYAIAALERCDATCFLYNCANSGTSGAIRLGMAAGKPLLAFRACRQMRDLIEEDAITWLDNSAQLPNALTQMRFGYDAGLIALAHRESWVRGGQRYAALYREIAASL